jgi:hypothetical protein
VRSGPARHGRAPRSSPPSAGCGGARALARVSPASTRRAAVASVTTERSLIGIVQVGQRKPSSPKTRRRLDDPERHPEHAARELGTAREQRPSRPRDREHPLARRDPRQHLLHPMRSTLRHASTAAARTEPAPFAREGDEALMVAPRALEPGEAELRVAARDELLELPLDVPGKGTVLIRQCRAQRNGPFCHDAVEPVVTASSDLDGERHEGPPPARPVPGRSRRWPIRPTWAVSSTLTQRPNADERALFVDRRGCAGVDGPISAAFVRRSSSRARSSAGSSGSGRAREDREYDPRYGGCGADARTHGGRSRPRGRGRTVVARQRRGTYAPPPGASDILGLEAAVTISSLGKGVLGWQVGDRVAALLAGGGYAGASPAPPASSFHSARSSSRRARRSSKRWRPRGSAILENMKDGGALDAAQLAGARSAPLRLVVAH